MLEKLNDVLRSELIEYVIERRAVLDYFRQLLGTRESRDYPPEQDLHSLFFPTRGTSDEVDYDQHNLWILDERLAYHHYLASDKELRAQKASPVESDSRRRPDLVIYNRSLAFSEGDYTPSSVVIVEFKRPERNDYGEDSSPVRQVYGYIKDILGGGLEREDGSIVRVPKGIPFYVHIVADLTARLVDELKDLRFTLMPDNEGWFTFNDNYKAYVEVVSYRKVLEDSIKRNQAFFRRLDLPLRP